MGSTWVGVVVTALIGTFVSAAIMTALGFPFSVDRYAGTAVGVLLGSLIRRRFFGAAPARPGPLPARRPLAPPRDPTSGR